METNLQAAQADAETIKDRSKELTCVKREFVRSRPGAEICRRCLSASAVTTYVETDVAIT